MLYQLKTIFYLLKEKGSPYQLKGDFPFAQDYLDYLEIECALAPRTVEEYCRDLQLFKEYMEKEFFPRGLKPEEVKAGHLRSFLAYLQEKRHNDARARNRKVSSLRSYFTFLNLQEYLERKGNPLKTFKNTKTKKALPLFLTAEEARTLIKASRVNSKLPYRDYAMMRLFLQTACRSSELVTLEREKVDLENGWVRIMGKGGKERILPLTESTARALEDYLQRRLPATPHITRVFLNHRGEPVTRRGVQMIFDRICREAGLLKPNLSVHKLRHTCLSLLLKEGVDLVTLKEIAGHADIGSTEIYLHVTPRELFKGMKKHPLG
ncbi:MAG: integrase [Candidatus Syntrophonatronum acetioxidans]|uniref:Integrase n=1 Tax=Candidatus Syntrophonatronum acetioxidans TaxID=1795816 RepID=A0A424YBI4_9FIRM|nr:MAG: integrase [Candidatus Syntrophonatronum acetioxidans]